MASKCSPDEARSLPKRPNARSKPSWPTARGRRTGATQRPLPLPISAERTSITSAMCSPRPRHSAAFPLVVDCANGATTTVAPRLFAFAWTRSTVIGNAPDGRNINLGCGSTHPERLAATVVERGCRARCGVRRRRRPRDLRRRARASGERRRRAADVRAPASAREPAEGNAIVATVMSNIGLELALQQTGIELVRCAVGDKYVMEEMLSARLALGGEQSGHIIFSEYLFTGDGLCTAMNVLRTIALTGRSLADLASDLVSYPQVLLNVRVREKIDLADRPCHCDVDRCGRGPPRRPGPAARALFGDRAAAAGDARRARRIRDSHLGAGDRRCRRETVRGLTRIPIPTRHDSPVRERQQGRDAAQLARRRACRTCSTPCGVSGCRRAGDHRASRAPTRATSRPPTCATSRRCSSRDRRRSSSTSKAIRGRTCSTLVHEVRPDQCTLVPVVPGEITSQAGWRAEHGAAAGLRRLLRDLQARGDPRQPLRRSRRRRPSTGRPRWAPTAWSCTPSRSPRAFERGGDGGARLVRNYVGRGASWRTSSVWA